MELSLKCEVRVKYPESRVSKKQDVRSCMVPRSRQNKQNPQCKVMSTEYQQRQGLLLHSAYAFAVHCSPMRQALS